MQFTGTIETILSPETISGKEGKTYTKQMFIMTDGKAQYPNKLLIEAFGKQDEMAKVSAGQTVTVIYNATVTEYNGKYYGKLSLYKFDTSETTVSANDPQTVEAEEVVNTAPDGSGSDLPF